MTLTEFTTWILIIIACGSSVVCSPPRINVTSEYVMDQSSESADLIIRCEAQQNVTWYWTAPLDDETVKDYLSITYTHHESTDHPFVSVLKLESPYSTDTGYYACQHNNAEDLNDQQNTGKTYVYVFDGDQGLAVPTELLTIGADTSNKLTLPCPVTKPNITVQLILNGEDISSNRNDVTWDPRVGFILRNLAVADSGLYQCKPNGYDDSVSFYVTISPAKDELDPPAIHYLPSSHFVVNYSFTLECIKSNNSEGIRLHWNFPRIDEKDAYTITNKSKRQGDQEYLLSSLTIKSATIKDKGEYKCTVSATGLGENSDIYTVNIKETLEPYINLTERDRIEVTEGGDVDWRTDVLAFPPNPQVIYKYYDGREVNDEDERITIEHHANQAESWLRIKNVTNNDFGVYFLEAISNDGETRRSTKTLIQVTSKPYTSVSLSDVIADNRSVTVECSAKGFPIENVNTTWQIEYCPVGLHTCKGQFTEILQLDDANSTWPENEGNVMRSFISFMPEESGQIKCKSQNVIGETSTTKVIRISDIDEAFSFTYTLNQDLINVADIQKKLTIIENDQFQLLCGGIKFDFKEVDLKKNEEGSSLIVKEDSVYSMIRKVSKDKVTKQYKGTYICTAVPHDTSKPKLVRRLDVNVQDELAPYFWGDPNMATNGKLDIEEGQKLVLSCSVRGMPKPEIDWYKDNELFTVDKNNEEIHMSKNLTILEFKFLKESHSGTYKCRAKNRKSHIEGQTILQVYKSQTLSKGAVIGLVIAVAIIIAMIVLVIWLFLRVKKEKDFKNEFRKNELYLFEKGNVGDLNQDCMADEQAQLLPYDKQWEIPRDDIEIGKQLGEGAFGRVVKALVQNLNDDNKGKITAVKMCKNQADPSQVRSLAGELKIMIHLGKHLNIVNLIGASTVNISKGELLILVEYCPFGNLLKFMLQHRHQFINQVDKESDRIDPAIMTVSSPISAGIIPRTYSVRSAVHPMKQVTDQDGYLAPSFYGNSQVSINGNQHHLNNGNQPFILAPPPKKRLTPIHSPTTLSEFSYPKHSHSPPISPTSPNCTAPMMHHSNPNTPTSKGYSKFLHNNNNLPPSSPNTPHTPSEHSSSFPLPPTPTSPTSHTSFESNSSRNYACNPSYSYNPIGIGPEGISQNSKDSHLLMRNSSEDTNSLCNGRMRERIPSGYAQESMLSGGTTITMLPNTQYPSMSRQRKRTETISSCGSGSNYDFFFSTTTLVLWAWQVAQGMEYLAKRKVLHGDLAARNLLLSENNVVKISDFGLSRDIYKKDVYMKKGDDLMPIKWMSIEAIRDRIFSVQSDVWAFGVTLWEMFTLSSTPYPGIEVNKDFLKLLDEDGYRMDQPKYSNKELYAIILDCWQSEPRSRPTYQAISERLENLLPKEQTKNFIDMNDINIQLNRERFEKCTDYLQMMGSPDFENITKQERNEEDNPDYANISHVNGDIGGSYLSMQTTAGYSKVGINPEYANADTIAMMRQTSSDHTLNNSNYLSMSQQRVSHIPNTDVFSPRHNQDISHFPYRERTHTVSSQPSILEETQEEVYHQDQDQECGNPDNIDNGRIMYMDRGNNEHISLLQRQNSNMNSGRTRVYSNGQDEVDCRNPDNINNGGMVYMDRGNNEHISLLQRQNSNMNGGRRRLHSNGPQNGDITDYMDEQTEYRNLNSVHSFRDSDSCVAVNTDNERVNYMNLPSRGENV